MIGIGIKDYRSETTRASWWDYGNPGCYALTICCKNMISFFGSVHNGLMVLNAIGRIAREEWLKTPIIRPQMEIVLDAFVVMPNHFHALLFLGISPQVINSDDLLSDALAHINSEIYDARRNGLMCNPFRPQSNNLPSVVRGFKSAVTAAARKYAPDFAWQPLFHDRIVRDYRELERWRLYIETNPTTWTNQHSIRP